MGQKGDHTRVFIKEKARELFGEKGFSCVTMNDICMITQLSRGGLYRHYESTRQIFEDILLELSETNENDIYNNMLKGQSAISILRNQLTHIKKELLDEKLTLTLAIYEYSCLNNNQFMIELNQRSIKKWSTLIQYGIDHKEFNNVNVGQVVDMILYSYQGVRMWSRVLPIQEETVDNIITLIQNILEVHEI